MERVAFIVDETGERIDCLLNPETFEVRRLAGVRAPGAGADRLVGRGRADDPVYFTGGGRTELLLDMVFDVDLVETGPAPQDVRQLTARLWNLAENSAQELGSARPPLVRLVWGKSWNVPAVVAAIAERFDAFTAAGAPGRSWMRVKLVRVDEPDSATARSFDEELDRAATTSAAGERPAVVEAIGDGGQRQNQSGSQTGGPNQSDSQNGGPNQSGVRFDLLANDALGSPLAWRQLAEQNGIDNPFDVPAGTVLAVPSGGPS